MSLGRTRRVLKIRQLCIDTLDKVDFPMPLFGKEGIGEIFFFTNGSIVIVINCSVGNQDRPLSMGQIHAAADTKPACRYELRS